MSNIYIIAGPPGIGKSTSGGSLVPEGIVILDPDQIANRYKVQGFVDYKDIGNLKFNELIKKELFAERDFAVELNLGFESHYDFVRSLKRFNPDNTIEVVLFFTDDIGLCFQRAELRYQAGLHYVSPEIIREMYENTMPLLQKHFTLFSAVTAVNITSEEMPKICLDYNCVEGELITLNNLPEWASKSIKDFLELKFGKSQVLSPRKQQTHPRKGNRNKLR